MEQKITRQQNDERFSPPDEVTARQLRALLEITRAFREISPTFPVTYMHAFLAVCLKPGGGATDYMAELDTVQPVMSRILLALGQKSRKGEEGHGLIDASPDPIDLRRNRAFLTPGGRALLAKVLREVRRIKDA